MISTELEKIRCPNPDCTGFVRIKTILTSDQRRQYELVDKKCPRCRHVLKVCPNCEAIMSEDIGICQTCHYQLESSSRELSLPVSQFQTGEILDPIMANGSKFFRLESAVVDQDAEPNDGAEERPTQGEDSIDTGELHLESNLELNTSSIPIAPSAQEAGPKPILVVNEASTDQVIHALANAYRDSALVGANMRLATEALESLRGVWLTEPDAFKVWQTFDTEVGRAEATQLRPVLMSLRQEFQDTLISEHLKRLQTWRQEDPIAFNQGFLTSYAEALSNWRWSLCEALVEEMDHHSGVSLLPSLDLRLMTRLVRHERWVRAYPLFQQLVEQAFIHPSIRARLLVSMGQIQLYLLERPEAGKTLFQMAEQLDPDAGDVLCAMGEYWLQTGDLEKAKARLETVIEQVPDETRSYVLRGDVAQREAQLEEAIRWYRQAITRASNSGCARLLRLLGHPDFIGRYESEILALADQAIAIAPQDQYTIYNDVAYAYKQGEQYDRAYHWYDQAIALDPTHPGAYIGKAYAYLDQKHYSEAVTTLQVMVDRVHPPSFDGQWGLAWAYELQERWSEALAHYRQALPLRPEWESAIRKKIGEMLWKLEQLSEAEQELLQALRTPDKPNTQGTLQLLRNLAEEYFKKRDKPEDAIRLYGEIRAIQGVDEEASYQNYVANVHYYDQRYETAAAGYRRAIAAAPEVAIYYSNLADAYQKLHRWTEARVELERAFQIDRQEKSYQTRMALTYNGEGNDAYKRSEFVQAIEKYQSAINFNAEDDVYCSNLALAWENLIPVQGLEAVEQAIAALESAMVLKPDNYYQNRLQRLRIEHRQHQRLENYKRAIAATKESDIRNFAPFLEINEILIEVSPDLAPQLWKTDQLTPEAPRQPYPHQAANDNRSLKDWGWSEYGLLLPDMQFCISPTPLPSGYYTLKLRHIPYGQGYIPADKQLFTGSREELERCHVVGEPTTNPANNNPAFWIATADVPALEQQNLAAWSVAGYCSLHLLGILRQYLPLFVHHQWVMDVVETSQVTIRNHLQSSPAALSGFTQVLKALVSEQASIKAIHPIATTFWELWSTGTTLCAIVEQIRQLPEVCPHLPGYGESHALIKLGPRLEAIIATGIVAGSHEPFLTLKPEPCQKVLQIIRDTITQLSGFVALLVERSDVRPFVRKLIELEFPNFFTIAAAELPAGYENRILSERLEWEEE